LENLKNVHPGGVAVSHYADKVLNNLIFLHGIFHQDHITVDPIEIASIKRDKMEDEMNKE
jgi:hypothetical protein